MPFRFSINFHHLNRFDLNRYAGRFNNGNPDGVDRVLKHVVIGTELILNKNIIISAGYNHRERKELSMRQVTGGAGFSLGFLVKTNRFNFSYAHAFNHVAAGSNYLTIGTDLKTFIRKKKLKE